MDMILFLHTSSPGGTHKHKISSEARACSTIDRSDRSLPIKQELTRLLFAVHGSNPTLTAQHTTGCVPYPQHNHSGAEILRSLTIGRHKVSKFQKNHSQFQTQDEDMAF